MRAASAAARLGLTTTFAIGSLALCAVMPAAADAQQRQISGRDLRKLRGADSAQVLIVRTRDGSALVGQVLAVEGDTLRFSARVAGVIALPLAQIESVSEVTRPLGRAGDANAYWFRNPNETRLLFAPTGRMLERGAGYFSDYYVVLPGFAYGVTDYITIGGGMSLLPGANTQAFYFTPKVGVYQSPKVNFAAGALVAGVPGEDVGLFGIVYGVGTFGGPDASITTGLGYGYADDELAEKPAVLLGADLRFSRRLAFVTENYVLPGVDEPIVSYGLRFFGEKSSLDLGFANAIEDPIFPGIPYVGFVFNF